MRLSRALAGWSLLFGIVACTTEHAPPGAGAAADDPERAGDAPVDGAGPSGEDAAGGAPAPPAPEAAGCTSPGLAPGNHDVTVASGGRMRLARVHVPPSYDAAKPTPVLLNFHGRNSNAAQEELLSKTTAKADAAGFVVVYPTGIGATWNAGLCCGQAQIEGIDDVAFTRALLDELGAELCVDHKRVFATGLSNGGFMANRLACELADRIAAIGPVAGQLLSSPCTPARPVPVIHFHGNADAIVPYQGGFGMPSVESSVAAWAGRNGCSSTAKQTYAKGDATCVAYGDCDAGADVMRCTIAGGGHTWPGGVPVPALGKTSQDIDATDAMWEFFVAHPMP